MSDSAHPFGRKARALAVIDPVSCTGCGYCAMFCIMKCILLRPDGLYEVDAENCIGSSKFMASSMSFIASFFLPVIYSNQTLALFHMMGTSVFPSRTTSSQN